LRPSISTHNFRYIIISGLLISGCAASRFQSVELAIRQQNWLKAQQALEEQVKTNPRDGDAHLLLAEVYGETDQITPLRNTLAVLRQLSPKYSEPAKFTSKKYWTKNFGLGIYHFEQRQFGDAAKRFQFATLLDSANTDGWQRLGDALFLSARYFEAKRAYAEVLPREPNVTVKNNLAEIYFIEKNYKAAVELCDEILSEQEDDLNALQRRAYSYDKLGKFSEAERDFLTAAKWDAASNTMTSVGLFYFRNGKYAKAISHFDKAVPTSDNPIVLYRYLGEANWRLRNFKAMAAWYQKIVAALPDDLSGWKNLAMAYEALGQRELLAQARSQIHKISSTN
jgi:tetratricopeptide (TPR) repeat protein